MKIIEPSFKILTEINRENILKLIEVAGRTCYKSEDKSCDGSAGPFVEKIGKVFKHECYDEETEVLSKRGWLFWKDVLPSDELATLTRAHVIEYHNPITLTQYDYTGKMYCVNSGAVDLKVTPNHRMLVCLTNTKAGRRKSDFQFIEASEVSDKSHCYTKIGFWGKSKNRLSDAELKLIGFTIGDGWTAGKRVYFHITLPRKIAYLRELAASLNKDLRELENNTYSLAIPNGLRELFEDIRKDDKSKQIPRELMFDISAQQSKSLLDGLMNSDGHIGRTYKCYSSSSKFLIDQVQQLALHAEVAATVTKQQMRGTYSSEDSVMWKAIILQKCLKPEVNKIRTKNPQTGYEEYSGKVYCAEVQNGSLYVRRRGRAVWCGNSVIEHAGFTVKFICDRGVSHELVRHRLASFSQESTRYCNFSKDKFGKEITVIKPPFFEKGDIKFTMWFKACIEAEQYYFDLLEAGASPQEARSVLPNSLKTEVIVTANMREWKHIFNLRCSQQAHPQIREVMIPLRDSLIRQLPEIFYEGQ